VEEILLELNFRDIRANTDIPTLASMAERVSKNKENESFILSFKLEDIIILKTINFNKINSRAIKIDNKKFLLYTILIIAENIENEIIIGISCIKKFSLC
jgi:hypothetical protein